MARAFLIYGILLCLGLAYANRTGWIVWNSIVSGSWGPKGQNMYHK